MKKCKVEGCASKGFIYSDKRFGRELCGKHYKQMSRHGEIRERTKFTPNEFITHNDVLEIKLYNVKSIETGSAFVDIRHYDTVIKYKWSIGGSGYCQGSNNGEMVLLHRLITSAPKGMVVDHIDHDTLNNLDNNLRICTQQDNAHNQIVNPKSVSGCNGVTWHSEFNSWKVQIKIGNENMFLGYIKDKQKAITIRKEAECKYYGKFAYSVSMNYKEEDNETHSN